MNAIEQGRLPGVQTDADFVRGVLIQSRLDMLAGKYGELSDDNREECERFLAEHGVAVPQRATSRKETEHV